MVTVDRVLPWRREPLPSVEEIRPLLGPFQSRQARPKADLILRAYELAAAAHAGQSRKSGEGYIHHPVKVAEIIAGLGLDEVTIAAALLHDVVEDTEITLQQIEEQFSVDVAIIVDGVTKLDRINFDSKEAQQAATMRKMFIAITKDPRVLIIKLADRLHNMRTIGSMPVEKQARIAIETRDVYAPLAHRLGMEDMKMQLEDLAFAALHPKWYAEIDHMVSTRAPERDLYLTQVVEHVRQQLDGVQIDAIVTGRPKHLWSIYEKMVLKSRAFVEIYDLVGLRVIVKTVNDCYGALGSIHASWKPVQGRFKDFIAMPKFNNYQSLHTTVIGPQGKPIELQIRTEEMHVRAEVGVAAHWRYKDEIANGDFEWLNRIVDWQSETTDPAEFMTNLKNDLDEEEVVVFSPKGKALNLPVGATPIDFAYTIHTEVGQACIGAKVNGALVDLGTRLESGDTIEIITSQAQDAVPSRAWLDIAVTAKARNRIRQQLSREDRKDSIDAGWDEIECLLRREGIPVAGLASSDVVAKTASALGFADVEALCLAVGDGRIEADTAAVKISETLRLGGPPDEPLVATVEVLHSKMTQTETGLHAEGLDDVLIRLSKCCTPVPGDEVIGFHTKGRGVSVHRADCANAVSLSLARTDRLVDVEWDGDVSGSFVASVTIGALDRPRLLRDVSAALADHHINILSCATTTGRDRICTMRFDFEMGDGAHLDSVLRMISGIEGVYKVERTLKA